MNEKFCTGSSAGGQNYSFDVLYAAIDSSWKAFALYWYGREGLHRRATRQ
ncbi:hypothetical protein NVIE_027410 [Nitrososphaera viennensis EN76]|uniref:Uncharacterized protein n=1 Tax=Nitrososphaera viennensis EN76 TaxID=926571 RepID=A0A060HNH9_9ARCH|nr:hypothetical protein NVIE_027410 [Nitrososphaera viennensis EN76]